MKRPFSPPIDSPDTQYPCFHEKWKIWVGCDELDDRNNLANSQNGGGFISKSRIVWTGLTV